MSAKPTNPNPQNDPTLSAPAVAQKSKKPGLLTRLFGRALTGAELEIVVSPFVDAAGVDHARIIMEAFSGLENIHLNQIRDVPILNPVLVRTDHLPAACAQAMNWVGKYNADLVIWGDVPPPGTTLFIHFAAPPPVDEAPAGTISPFQALMLPVGFNPQDLGALLCASALAAMHPQIESKRQNRRQLVAETLEHAAAAMDHIRADFTVREQASIHAMFANALASFGHLFPGTEVYQRASQSYAKAIKGMQRTESPTNWAYLQRNLATVLQAIGERNDDSETLTRAVEAYRAALEVFSLETTPFPWATTQNQLGEVLYRLDLKNQGSKNVKEALGLFQGALKVLSKRSTPMLWSQTMNNFGQAAQVLGRELKSEEILSRAVEAYAQALTVRQRLPHPTLWAATQNNMGSALFSLGRMTDNSKHLEAALDAFMGAREVYSALGLTRMVEITEKNIAHTTESLPEGVTRSSSNDPAMWWLEDDDPSSKK